MARLDLDRLHRDLEAMGEAHVRNKALRQEFPTTQTRAVEKWLSNKDAERAAQQAAQTLAISQRNARWTMIGAIGTIGALLVAFAALYAK